MIAKINRDVAAFDVMFGRDSSGSAVFLLWQAIEQVCVCLDIVQRGSDAERRIVKEGDATVGVLEAA
ncbi:hypothetical protein D3C76_1690530 [compost metagenome]